MLRGRLLRYGRRSRVDGPGMTISTERLFRKGRWSRDMSSIRSAETKRSLCAKRGGFEVDSRVGRKDTIVFASFMTTVQI